MRKFYALEEAAQAAGRAKRFPKIERWWSLARSAKKSATHGATAQVGPATTAHGLAPGPTKIEDVFGPCCSSIRRRLRHPQPAHARKEQRA